jgi:3-hydroxymyristoyl/3-hydroxydecanoyl-(acyl carrier protein) dehydratase
VYPSGVINPKLELELEIDPEALTASWTIPESLPYLQGHFPGLPMLPGIATIDATVEAIRRVRGMPTLRLRKIENAKFKQPIFPGQKIRCQLSTSADHAWKAQWQRYSGSTELETPVSVAELTLVLS